MIILKGEPRSTNHFWKSTCRGRFASVYMTVKGRSLKESYQYQAKAQWLQSPLEGELYVHIKLYMGTKRKSDIDNFNKILLDALSGIVWFDDSQIVKMLVEKKYDKDDPRIEIHAEPAL